MQRLGYVENGRSYGNDDDLELLYLYIQLHLRYPGIKEKVPSAPVL